MVKTLLTLFAILTIALNTVQSFYTADLLLAALCLELNFCGRTY